MLHLLFVHRECVGCGYCCLHSQCEPGQQRYGHHRICPGLYWNGSRYRCAYVEEDATMRAMVQTGEGCCRPFNRWRKDVWQRVRTPVRPSRISYVL